MSDWEVVEEEKYAEDRGQVFADEGWVEVAPSPDDWQAVEKTLHSIPHVNTTSGWNVVDREPALAALARLREREAQLERELHKERLLHPRSDGEWAELMLRAEAAEVRVQELEEKLQEVEHPFDHSEYAAMVVRVQELEAQDMEELSKPLIARGDNVMGIAAVAMILSLVWLGIGFALGWWIT